MNPANYKPTCPKDLIGKAAKMAVAIFEHATKTKHEGGTFRVLFHGGPGTGKTTIANMIAEVLATDRIDIESTNGRSVTIDVVRDWQRNNRMGSLFGGWRVKIINEIDLVPVAAQDLMLTYLDELGPKTAVIGTSNENVGGLQERFRSRFQMVNVPAPTESEIADWLKGRWNVATKGAAWIAAGCCGNVRQALLDAGTYMMTGFLPEPVKQERVTCSARSESAKRAWDTMRAKAVTA